MFEEFKANKKPSGVKAQRFRRNLAWESKPRDGFKILSLVHVDLSERVVVKIN